jgi:predicted MFS family arabinose efflux permease
LDVLQGVINWNSTLGAWLPGYMFDLSGSYQSALVLNVLTAWIAIGVILWISEW